MGISIGDRSILGLKSRDHSLEKRGSIRAIPRQYAAEKFFQVFLNKPLDDFSTGATICPLTQDEQKEI